MQRVRRAPRSEAHAAHTRVAARTVAQRHHGAVDGDDVALGIEAVRAQLDALH